MIYSKLVTILIIVIILICASLFSFLETATVAISEHRLKVLQHKFRWANYAYLLKKELNSVLIFSLFGNSLFNAVFTTLSTVVVTSLIHDLAAKYLLPIVTIIVAFIIIIFSEALPKIIASRSPLQTLRFVSIPLYYVFYLCKPIIWLLDNLIHYITIFLHISNNNGPTKEELKSIIADKNSPFSTNHKTFLLNSIDLIGITIKEIIIPLRTVESINISDDIDQVRKKIYTTLHTRIIVYDNKIDNIVGYIHIKDILPIENYKLNKNHLLEALRPITFIHDFIPIIKQIQLAQLQRKRIFVVINEYGDILGIACLEDMLEMIFGDFTTDSPQRKHLVIINDQEEFIVDGTMLIRELNEKYNLGINYDWDSLTMNGLVLKILNGIPNSGVAFKLDNLIFEVISVGKYWVERVKITKMKQI